MERPYIDYKKCKKTGTCMQVCPVGVFAKEGDKYVVKNPEACIQCRACEASCPEKAIQVK
ncbi:MAG: 4Fe-4S binding protein [Candidatus Diapherotrites archaeon]|nr:4Fe-4S binding protein [Candidatus Diapherotrites archaeon]